MATGVKQLAIWFFNASTGRINSRGKTIDFKDNGEPDEQVFRNLVETVYKKRVADDFQDQATYQDVNNRVNIDKATTPDNLPVTVSDNDAAIVVTETDATNESAPHKTYKVKLNKAVYNDILAGDDDKVLTAANYPVVTSPDSSITVTPVQVGNSIEFQIELPALPSINLIIPITYTDLVTAINTSTLKPGYWYQFAYQCIHQIPYTNVLNTSSTLTIPTETLLVQALSVNSLDRTQVRCLEHPQDIIHWRWEDNKVVTPTNEDPLFTTLYMDTINDGMSSSKFAKGTISFVSPTVNRAGRIYYREDTIQRISTPYDFRGVVLRRWALSKDGNGFYVFKNTLSYTASTSYKHHDIILDGANYWLVVYPFVSTASISNHTYNLVRLNDIIAPSSGNTPQFIATNPTSYVIYDTDNQYFSTKVEIQVDSTFEDHFTFYNVQGTLQAYNVKIKDYIPAWIEAVTWEFYPNIVFGTHLNGGITPITNVEIANFSYDLTLFNLTSVRIGAFCRDIFINGRANGSIGNIDIADNNQFLHIDQMPLGGETTTTKRLINKIGLGNRGLVLWGGAYDIGTNNNRVMSYSTSNVIIGDTNYVLALVAGSHEIGDFNSFVCLNSCVTNTVGDRNRNIFNVLGTNTRLGNYNVDINSLKANLIEGVGVPHSNNVVGNNCSILTISGNNNYYDRVSGMLVPDGVTITSCKFDNIGGIAITNTGAMALTRSIFRDINGVIGLTDSNTTDSLIERCPNLVLTNVTLNLSKISVCGTFAISFATITRTNFEFISIGTLTFVAGSSIVYSKFEKISNLTMTFAIPAIIGYLNIIDNSTIALTSSLVTGLTNIVINHVDIENTSNITLVEINSSLQKTTIKNTYGLYLMYAELLDVTFNQCINPNFGTIPFALVPTNAKISITDTIFENLSDMQLLPATNDGAGITNFIVNISKSHFKNSNTTYFYVLAKTAKTNIITLCEFNSIQAVNFGSIPVDALALEPLNYDSSIFTNMNTISGGSLAIATPRVSRTTMKNYYNGGSFGTGGICYRVSLIECDFDGFIKIREGVVAPNYSFRNVLTRFKGAGDYKKTIDASINTTGYSIDNRLLLTASLPLDTMPADASDTDYKVSNGTVICGIRNVITGVNIVETPVNLTLV